MTIADLDFRKFFYQLYYDYAMTRSEETTLLSSGEY